MRALESQQDSIYVSIVWYVCIVVKVVKSLEVREAFAGDDSLGDNTAEGKHSQPEMRSLFC
jgi:hypothetical protein